MIIDRDIVYHTALGKTKLNINKDRVRITNTVKQDLTQLTAIISIEDIWDALVYVLANSTPSIEPGIRRRQREAHCIIEKRGGDNDNR